MIRDLSPAYFAMVMATGIISIALELRGFRQIAFYLFFLNNLLYVILWLLTIIRFILFPENVVADLANFTKGAGFLTVVAGTCILGSQFVIFSTAYWIAIFLLIVGFSIWFVLMYSMLTTFIISENKPVIQDGISGTWLLFIVSTQSVSILVARLVPQFSSYVEILLLFAVCMFFLGSFLYILIITLILYRLLFFSVTPQQLNPPYWINMGAIAITTLAGTILIPYASQTRFLEPLASFITGITVLFWATATWWIPLLMVLTVWRHVIGHVKLSYNPEYWSLVFPLGMYTTCTVHLGQVLDLRILTEIAGYFSYIAFLAWLTTFAGILNSSIQFVFETKSPLK
ncbi:tellurite resistance/C4-dicarboxylate transporter family protein [Desulfomonile tiedjei]|nr:tellurite resistance/C4-dicarboxylate transporter family protein [Desulfomonile tiedjei]